MSKSNSALTESIMRLVMFTRVLDYLDIPISGPAHVMWVFRSGWWGTVFMENEALKGKDVV